MEKLLKDINHLEKCLSLSAELWNEYLNVSEVHPSERSEFALSIHALQDKLAIRMMKEYRPDIFPNKMEKETSIKITPPSISAVIEYCNNNGILMGDRVKVND